MTGGRGLVRQVDDVTFADVVLGSAGPVLVDFHANWCGPCHQLTPVLDDLADELPWMTFTRVDVDTAPVTAGAYRVTGLPTMLVFRSGEPVLSIVGARSKRVVREMLDALADQRP